MTADATLPSYREAADLERELGDPCVDDNPLSFRAGADIDDREEYPRLSLDVLDRAGLHHHYVPSDQGGRLTSYETLLWLLRAVGRRDFTAAVTHAVSVPPATLVWYGGSVAQRAKVAHAILAGEQLSIAFHEKEHGNDFMATEVAAHEIDNGYALTGEKWAVANARRSVMLVVLARTDPSGGPRGFSLVLVDKREGDARTLDYSGKLRTHGVRGQEIDGIRFDGHQVPADAILGGVGAGFELSLKCSQISRTLSLSPLLGALDTAFRATVSHLLRRKLYGEPAFEIPAVRATVVDAFLDLVLAECATLTATRGIHLAPRRMAVWAPAAKAFTTSNAERMLHDLSVVMGARFYLRDVWWHGIFEKIVRDAPMTRVSHFGGVISLVHLGATLQSVYQRAEGPVDVDLGAMFRPLFDVTSPLPAVDAAQLRLVPHGVDELALGLRFADEHLASGVLDSATDPAVLGGIRLEVGRLMAEANAIRSFLSNAPDQYGPGFGRAPELLEVAKRHAALFAASSAVLLWLFGRASLDEFGKQGDWLYLALRRVREQLRPSLEVRPLASEKRVSKRLIELLDEGRWFSVFAPLLAANGSRPATEGRS